jgi:uncharacterized protein
VFLTDREVWKLKRPVDYGFVNCTTLERRRRYCEDEVRLNRRLAPDVYLGVVPVRLGPEGYEFGADGKIVDYAVRMRRLADEHSAEALLRRRALTPDHVTRLAVRLAQFFHDTTATPEAGAVEALRDNVIQNFTQVEPFVGRLISPRGVRRHADLAARNPGPAIPPILCACRTRTDPRRASVRPVDAAGQGSPEDRGGASAVFPGPFLCGSYR